MPTNIQEDKIFVIYPIIIINAITTLLIVFVTNLLFLLMFSLGIRKLNNIKLIVDRMKKGSSKIENF